MKTTSPSSVLLLRRFNKLRSILLAVTAVALLSVGYSAKADLISNGGFETGDFTDWTAFFGLVSGTDLGVAPHSGNFQAEFGASRVLGTLSQSVSTTPGQSYTIDFWLASVNPVPGVDSFSVSWGGVPIFTLLDQPSFVYGEHTFTETTSTASTALEFDFANSFGSTWFLDDVSVNPVAAGVPDSGSTLGLLLLSLAAMFGVSRLRCLRFA